MVGYFNTAKNIESDTSLTITWNKAKAIKNLKDLGID